jgi:hypothetical protein
MRKFMLPVFSFLAVLGFASSVSFAQSLGPSAASSTPSINAAVSSFSSISPEPAPTAASSGSWAGFAVGLKVGLYGLGPEVAVALTHRLNVRGGFNWLGVSDSFHYDGASYNADLHFRSIEAHLDWFPIGSFHISPGVLLYNGNRIDADVSIPGGQDFTLNGASFMSSASDPVTGGATLSLGNKVAPEITVGFGNMVPRNGKHWAFTSEFGVAYFGPPGTVLSLTGTACDTSGANCQNVATSTTIQSDVQGEEAKIYKSTRFLHFYPVASFGVSYRF